MKLFRVIIVIEPIRFLDSKLFVSVPYKAWFVFNSTAVQKDTLEEAYSRTKRSISSGLGENDLQKRQRLHPEMLASALVVRSLVYRWLTSEGSFAEGQLESHRRVLCTRKLLKISCSMFGSKFAPSTSHQKLQSTSTRLTLTSIMFLAEPSTGEANTL